MTKKARKIKTSDEAIWETTTERFVGFIDIMGFKDMVARNSHMAIYNMMKKISKSIEAVQSTHSIDYLEDGVDMNVAMTTYSDSIMIYSRTATLDNLDNFIACISSLSEFLFKDGIPHKGAIAFGKMTLDFKNSIFFGQPLIDAYLLQEELNFYGIAVHSTAEYRKGVQEDDAVIEYNCNFKTGIAKHFTILPSTFFVDPFSEKEFSVLRKSVVKLGKNTSGGLRKYIDNTLNYLDNAKNVWTTRIAETSELRNKATKNPKLPF